MHKLRINASDKSDYNAEYYDATSWWKNFNDFYETVATEDTSRPAYMLQEFRCRSTVVPEWVLIFETEEDATAFVLRFS